MRTEHIAFQETGRFSSLICDYLKEDKGLQPFYGLHPNIKNFKAQIKAKKSSFSIKKRSVLSRTLRHQYSILKPTKAVKINLNLLEKENTFTVTTGHQLCLMTGPLYFLYKIISAINLCDQLKKAYPESNFIPIYWMASEDHDFEEISSFRFRDKNIFWSREAAGAVGDLPLIDLKESLDVFESNLGDSSAAQTVKKWILNSYKKGANLSEATFRLVDQLFGKYGLVVLEPNKKELKLLFSPIIREELTEYNSFESVKEQIDKIKKVREGYNPQVNPRKINLFYLTDSGRYRIEKEGEYFVLNGTDQRFNEKEFLVLAKKYPERFSPNVILRPVYQEVILPNLCYIGGGGELAYWFQLKNNFDRLKVPFPILLLRNSAIIYSEKLGKKINKLNIEKQDLFLKRNSLINKKINQISNINLDLSFLKQKLNEQFDHLNILVEQTDKSFKGAVEAQKIKQFKGIEHLEKRLLKAQKRALLDKTQRLIELHNCLFPDDTLQERTLNFVDFYLEMEDSFFPILFKALDPMNSNFVMIEY